MSFGGCFDYQRVKEEIDCGMASREENCRCGGEGEWGGWILSDYDTWHHCPLHYNGQEHPEVAMERMENPNE